MAIGGVCIPDDNGRFVLMAIGGVCIPDNNGRFVLMVGIILKSPDAAFPSTNHHKSMYKIWIVTNNTTTNIIICFIMVFFSHILDTFFFKTSLLTIQPQQVTHFSLMSYPSSFYQTFWCEYVCTIVVSHFVPIMASSFFYLSHSRVHRIIYLVACELQNVLVCGVNNAFQVTEIVGAGLIVSW
jgi:hypothetical protein